MQGFHNIITPAFTHVKHIQRINERQTAADVRVVQGTCCSVLVADAPDSCQATVEAHHQPQTHGAAQAIRLVRRALQVCTLALNL